MTDSPILFSAPMVRAILDGRKTKTRRVVKGRWIPIVEQVLEVNGKWVWDTLEYELKTPYGRPGDRLWVRETWGINDYRYSRPAPIPKTRPDDLQEDALVYFATECDAEITNEMPQTPAIHMPRWASRITLEVSDIKVERLQDISDADAICEGVEYESADPGFYYVPGIYPHSITAVGIEEPGDRHAARSFAKLWDHINAAKAPWSGNPWVWVVQFKGADL